MKGTTSVKSSAEDLLGLFWLHRNEIFPLGVRLVTWLNVAVPSSAGQQFGSRQWGFHADLVYPIWKTNLLNWKNVVLNTNFRIERVDYNWGTFNETGDSIGDDITALVPGVSLRFSANTVLKANYRYHWQKDLLANPASRTAGFQFGFASYF